MISSFRGKHAGQVCAILANGPSLKKHDLSRLRCPTIGTNRSWELLWPTYHVVCDGAHYKQNPEVYEKLHKEGRLFVHEMVGKNNWPVGIKLYGPLNKHMTGGKTPLPFSLDIEQGVQLYHGPVGSVGFLALQIAVYMGFSKVFFLGLDLQGLHFYPRLSDEKYPQKLQDILNAQIPLYGLAASVLREYKVPVEVYVCGSPESKCEFWPKVPFEALLEAQA